MVPAWPLPSDEPSSSVALSGQCCPRELLVEIPNSIYSRVFHLQYQALVLGK